MTGDGSEMVWESLLTAADQRSCCECTQQLLTPPTFASTFKHLHLIQQPLLTIHLTYAFILGSLLSLSLSSLILQLHVE